MDVTETVQKFDSFLKEKGEIFEAVVIGGAALNVMSIIHRETIDVDCLSPKIPDRVLIAAAEFRRLNPSLKLIEKWINNGPSSLVRDLETGWESRIVEIFRGEAIIFHTLGRIDLLKTKLYAYCDRDTDLEDCIALKPTKSELEACYQWVAYQDANPTWPLNVTNHFNELKEKLGHGK